MLKTSPDPVDVSEIQFKLHCSLKVFNNNDLKTFQNNHSLISCASRYGLLFVGSNTANLKVIQLKAVENYTQKDKEISKFSRRNISLPSPPTHVCVNCDSTLLAIIVQKDNCPVVMFYDVLSFYKHNIHLIREVRLSPTPGTFVTEVNWNPALPTIFTACKSDGSLGIYELKDSSIDINELPIDSKSSCFCWSPKGKQIAVGSKNCSITQYKPDLKAVKMIKAPTFTVPHSLISLCWVSNYQFIGVYQQLEGDRQALLIVIDAPKTGETTYTNYDDVCYSGTSRTPQFFLILIQHWNLLMVASSNSMELGLLGAVKEAWTQWNVPDHARAELPLGSDKQDTLPIGMAVDISNTKPLPWGEGTIPPCPYLLLLSHQGVLYFYDIVNLKQGMPSICCPPDNITDTSGMPQFVMEEQGNEGQPDFSFTDPQQRKVQVLPSQAPPQITQSSFNFSNAVTTQPVPAFGVTNAPPTSLFITLPESKPMFSNKITVTPVKPQPQQTIAPSPFGENLTVTPVKQQITDAGEKYASIFAALKSPSTGAPVAASKPIVIATKPEPSKVTSEISKSLKREVPKSGAQEILKHLVLENSKTALDAKLAIDEKVKGETRALVAKMVKDECVTLESELKALLHQGMRINVNIGTEEEKVTLMRELLDMQEFVKEIVDVSLGEGAEVHSLKQNLILSWAWYEEALSRYNVSKDETMSLILNNQPLDSATEKRRSDIRKIIYYLDSQISQASKTLDEQWDKFQDYAKKSCKEQIPTMEAIFQTMVRQNGILQKQSQILKVISNRIKHSKMSAFTSAFIGPNINKLEEDFKCLQLEPENSHRIIYDQIVCRKKKFTFDKVEKLRKLLKSREVLHITAIKPPLNTSLTRSPANRNKHMFSILGAQMSPVAKPGVVKNLKFSESTPLKVEARPTAVPPNTPAQIDISNAFTFKSLDPHVPPPTNTFHSLSKSTSMLSNLIENQSSSAFVPTTQAAKNFALSSVSHHSGITPDSPSIQTLSQFSFNSTKLSTKPESVAFSISPATSTQDIIKPGKEAVKSAGSAMQSSFSFGKSSNAATTAVKSAPHLVTPKTTTSQSLFSYGKSTVIDATIATNSMTSSKPNLFGNSQISIQSAITVSTGNPMPTVSLNYKPNVFVSSNTTERVISSTNVTKPIGSAPLTSDNKIVTSTVIETTKNMSVPNFSGGTTAITTQTTSLFGSISSSSITNSLFGEKVVLSDNANSSLRGKQTTVNTSTSITDPADVSLTATKSTLGSGIKTFTSIAPTTTISSTLFTPTTIASTTTITVESSLPSNSSLTTPTKPTSFFSSKSNADLISTATESTVVASKPPSVPAKKLIFKKKSLVGTQIAPPLFGSNITTSCTAVTQSTMTMSTKDSIFGGTFTSTTAQTTSVVDRTSSTQTPNVGSTAASTSQAIVLDSTPATNQTSIFDTTTITKRSIFDIMTNSTPRSAFNSATTDTPTTTTSTSIFGNTGTDTTPISLNPATPTSASIFGNTGTATTPISLNPATTTSSIFGIATTQIPLNLTTTTPPSIFGNTGTATTQTLINPTAATSSIFGNTGTPTTQTPLALTTTTPPSIFGNTGTATTQTLIDPTATTSPSIFGNTGTSTTQTPLTLTTTTPSSIFGNTGTATTQTLINPTTTTTSSIFGNTGTTTTQTPLNLTQSSLTPTTIKSPSIFGNIGTATTPTSLNPATTTSASIFGNTGTVTTQTSLFNTPTTTSQASIFGATSTTDQPTHFGNLPFGKTTTTQSSIFGKPATTQPSVFGISTTTQPSIFGSSTGSQSTGFGTTVTSTSSSVFGGGGTNTETSIFGTTSTTKPSIFGAQSTSGGSIFSNTPSSAFESNNTTGSFFGSAPVTNSTSIFGSSAFGTPTTTTTSATFGQPASFGSTTASIFGTPTTSSGVFGTGSGGTFGTTSTSNNMFGGSSSNTFSFASAGNNAGGSLGFGGLNVSNSPTTTSSIFGGSPAFSQAPPNPFTRNTSFETTASTTGSIFGNTGSAFGNNTQSTFGSTAFGSSPGFGQQSNFGQSNFGQQQQPAFGTSQSGPFSGGGVGVGQSGFGSSSNFQKPAGFGAAPVFGGSPQPAFGGSPSFGAAPAFGGAPTFGSPPKVFGSSTPTAAFGTTTSGSSGFGNLASQNTVGFGSLAQQAATSTSTPFTGNSSFSSWR